jgi:hypothetical protein
MVARKVMELNMQSDYAGWQLSRNGPKNVYIHPCRHVLTYVCTCTYIVQTQLKHSHPSLRFWKEILILYLEA